MLTRMLVAVLSVAVVVVVGCACQPDAKPAPEAMPPTIAAPSMSASPVVGAVTARERAIAAYRGMWAAYQRAAEVADPDYPDLATYTTDAALQTLTAALKSIKGRGLVAKGEIVLSPRVTALEPADKPTTIQVTDCGDDSKSLLYRQSGELYNDKPGGRRLIIATVKDTGGGVWKVVSFGARDIGTC